MGLILACLTVSISLFTMVWVAFMRQVSKTDFVEWDVKTITAGDYTVEFNINFDFYTKFTAKHGHLKPNGVPMARFFS